MPVVEAVWTILQACEGVAEAHAAGLVHRDLKPANLFLASRRGEPPVVKVLDFGLSKAFDQMSDQALTQTTSNFGTPAYMSPEQIRSAKYVDPRSDQHALGMILFELLTGHAPYTAESLTGLAVVISTEPPPHARAERREVPEALDAAICKALAKRQPDRYPSLAGFAAAIAPFGGPKAKAAADRIAAVLEASSRISDPGSISGSGRISLLTDDSAGRPPQRNTHSPTTSDPTRRTVARAAPIAAAIFGVVVIAFGVILVAKRFTGSSPAQPAQEESTSPATTAALVPAGNSGLNAGVNSIVTPAPAATSSASSAPPTSSAAAPEPQASASANPTKAPAGSAAPNASSKPSVLSRPPSAATTSKSAGRTPKRPRDVFGGDR
jgi:serine/threonine-protein kinase